MTIAETMIMHFGENISEPVVNKKKNNQCYEYVYQRSICIVDDECE